MEVTKLFTHATKLVLMWSLMVGGFCETAVCQYVAEFSSYHAGKRYDFRVTRERIAKTPVWLEDAANPPLSAREAKAVAIDYMKTLFSDAENWRLSKIALQPISDRWVYAIEFTEPPPPGHADYLSSPFSVIVTMDGVAVPPVISERAN